MNKLQEFIKGVCEICMYDLSANCDMNTHTDYIVYRLEGGELSEEEWYFEQCK